MIQRTRKMTFRLTQEEYEKIKNKVNVSGISQQQFLLRTALEKEIINIREFQSLILQIKKIGININQITRNCNETGFISESEISEIRKGMERVWQLLKVSKIHIPV